MVKFIESHLSLLKKEVDDMWALVYNQMEKAINAVNTVDTDLAQQVIVREKRVNAYELKIDSTIENIIALYSPVAVDLRFVLAMLKINSDLERLGDFAEGIAWFVIHNKEYIISRELLESLQYDEMGNQVLTMLKLTREALDEENISIASSIFSKDNLLDEINRKITGTMSAHLLNHPEDTRICLDLVSVFRKLERSGDHITNMAESIIFHIDAKVLKHSDKQYGEEHGKK